MNFVLLALLVCVASLQAQSLGDGIRALDAGRLDDAERIFSTVVHAQPNHADANFYLGLTHLRAGHASAALPPLERAVSLAPGNAKAWKTLGVAATSGGDPERAGQALGKACELAPKDEEACYYFARSLYSLGRYESAREPFEKALRAASKQILPRVHRGAALNFSALGIPAEAERHFVTAIALHDQADRGGEDPRIDFGAFLFRQGRTEEALGPLEKAAQDAPSSSRANTEWGRVLLHLDRVEAAAACLEKAVAAEPNNGNAHLLLGSAYLRLGRTSEGEKEMRLGREGWAAKK
jgi:tetratricopeptide (TPR) repeat protein